MNERREYLNPTLALACLGAFVAFTLWLSWVGWLNSDDHRHVTGALGWYRQFPYLAQTHGEFRHLIVIPLAFSFKLFGISESTIVLPNLLYYAATLLLTYFCVGQRFGRSSAILSVLIIASAPVFSIRATVVYSDITELFFVTSSLWLFLSARHYTRNVGVLLASGAAAGLAWLTRETTIALILVYGLLFLFSSAIPRTRYVWMGIGFFLVAGLEALFMYQMTGNPVYRYTEILSARQGFSYHGPVQGGGLFDTVGNVHVSPYLDPLVALFLNHEFGVIFFMYIPALVWLWRRPALPETLADIARILSVLSVVWFLFCAFALTNMHPRYFSVTAYSAAIVCSIWIVYGLRPRSVALAGIVGLAIVCAGISTIYLDNRNPLFAERALKELVMESDEIVHTDPYTARRAAFLLELDGLAANVSTGRPPAGALYYYNPNRKRDRRQAPDEQQFSTPLPHWEKIWEKEEPHKAPGTLLRALGLAGAVPESLFRRLDQPNRPVAAYRVKN